MNLPPSYIFNARHSCRSLPKKQGGMALFVTLIMTTIVLLIMAAIAYQEQLDFKRSSQMLISDQVVLLALSGESWAKKLLLDDDLETDSLEDDWAQALPVLPVEGGLLTGCIRDLNGRFNLNNLGFHYTSSELFDEDLNKPTLSSEVYIYLNLLTLLELDSSDERAALIIDWIDSDDELISPGSAEDADYSREDPPRMAANNPLTDLSEFVSVYGYSSADLLALKPYVSALGDETKININTANRVLMLSLMTGINEFVVDAVIEARPFASIDDFYTLVSDETSFSVEEIKADILPDRLIDVISNYFELNAQVSMAGINMGLRSVFYRGSASEIRVISRTFDYIPALSIEEGQVDPLISPCYVAPEGDELL